MNTGDHVAVSFISENSTQFSGIHFAGNGIIDRLEDNRVFGHLYSGQPFMCNPTDVSVNVDPIWLSTGEGTMGPAKTPEQRMFGIDPWDKQTFFIWLS